MGIADFTTRTAEIDAAMEAENGDAMDAKTQVVTPQIQGDVRAPIL